MEDEPLERLWLLAFAGLLSGPVWAQEATSNAPPGSAGAAKQWSFSASATGYAVPHNQFYVSPTFGADRGWLHLEARYNYENLETGSLWTGYNFSFGDKLVLEVTPMIGGVFGKTTGIAPGYQGTLSYKRLELFTQGEYVVDTDDRSGNFFYTWSELSYSPVDWLRTGIVVQRTRAYQTELDIQRGFLVGLSHKKLDFTTYVFNAGWTDPTLVFSLGVRF